MPADDVAQGEHVDGCKCDSFVINWQPVHGVKPPLPYGGWDSPPNSTSPSPILSAGHKVDGGVGGWMLFVKFAV